LAQIPPGDYQILAFDRPQPELEYRNEEAMRKYESREQEIRLLPGQNARLRVHMILGSE
jgi:beta-xylosidase